MNYYIQGNAANADKIKAAFEKLGIDVLDFGFADKTLVYCSIGGCVQSLPYSINLMHILYSHPDYKELELPVEPKFKFKVGDWIVRGEGFVYEPSLITEIRDYYICELLNGERVTYTLNDVHKNFHLWAIADAKDGDVLYTLDSQQPFIFKERPPYSQAIAYCGINKFGDFFVYGTKECVICIDHYIPATKEQRDLLFAKMKEAGYKWDADNKELKKIQPHYDIANFYAGMPVLVRDDDDEEWNYLFFSHYRKKSSDHFFASGNPWCQCVPFSEDTKHLLGTTDMCSEEYINW